MSQQRVIEYHIARLKDRQTAVRLDALHQLNLLKPDGFIDTIETVFRSDGDTGVRDAARKILADFYGPRLKSEQVADRTDALHRYAKLHAADSLQVIQTAFNRDADASVRDAARQLLIEYHMERLKSGDVAARSTAIDSLEQLNADEALEMLQQVFNTDGDGEVRKLAQKAGRTIFTNTRNKRA